jgi:hypothetical protein
MRSSAFRQLRESPAVADPADAIFDLSPAVRYVAFAHGQDVRLRERPGLSAASSGESDRYEELLVNPALITLARQRGDIDCGGLDYLIVAYGSFFQLMMPLDGGGHVSVAVERSAAPTDLVDPLRVLLGQP